MFRSGKIIISPATRKSQTRTILPKLKAKATKYLKLKRRKKISLKKYAIKSPKNPSSKIWSKKRKRRKNPTKRKSCLLELEVASNGKSALRTNKILLPPTKPAYIFIYIFI